MKKDMQLARLLNEIHEKWAKDNGYRDKPQATSSKLQAPSSEKNKPQASSPKHKGSSVKPKDSSAKIPEPGKSFTRL
tara:strand:- start:216 stop:446 length:231 start_codon:yes stop_codon:yes gene_type:complete